MQICLMILAVILFFGIIGDKENFNKRTYCYAFVACVAAIAVLEVMGGLL